MEFGRNSSRAALARARTLRSETNKPERRLWALLRKEQLGFKFRRQHPIGPFVVDFFCMEAKLAIELVGPSHEQSAPADSGRDSYLQKLGIETLRIGNSSLEDPLTGFLKLIQERCESRTGRKGRPLDW